MRRKIMQFAVVLSMMALCLLTTGGSTETGQIVRIGLAFGDNARVYANLENSAGTGYAFGYFSDDLDFISLGETSMTKITMLKTQNIYLQNGSYTDTQPSGDSSVIGCYHLQLPDCFDSFEEAQNAADEVSGGFPAWIDGTYYVRLGAYATKAEAAAAGNTSGIDGIAVVGTSSYGISVVSTKTTTILFQFDGGENTPLGVKPGLEDDVKAVTWFANFRYYGAFRYERIGGGNITVVNILPLEDYVKGVIPYEMSPTWPLEALKAQAVSARTYTMITLGKHSKNHFDLCNTTDCQVYYGLNSACSLTDQAVDETSGILARYDGELAQTYYFSSDGGATEDVKNVWNSTTDFPYLKGVVDPYEETVEDKIPSYRFSVTLTKDELAEKLHAKGYLCAAIVDFRVSEFSETGNAITITFVDANGKEWSFSKEKVRTLLSLRSIRYTVSGGGKYYLNGTDDTLSTVIGAYAIDGTGKVSQISGAAGSYVITGSGTQALTTQGNTFTITGAGYGHNVGMSQWGAYAMAKLGYTYEDILKFYFSGIDLY